MKFAFVYETKFEFEQALVWRFQTFSNILVPVRIRLCVVKMMAGVFSVSALNQIHRVNVSSSENPVQTSDLASRVKLRRLWRVIVLYKF